MATLVEGSGNYTLLGIIDCSNPVHRVMDKAAWISVPGYDLQCNGTITPYSNVLGELYGLLYIEIPGLTFIPGHWDLAQYQLVAQVVNNQRWFVNNKPIELLSSPMLDQYIIQSWLNPVVVGETTDNVPFVTTTDNTGGSWDFNGFLGSKYANLDFLLNGTTAQLVLDNRLGVSAGMHLDTSIRIMAVNASFDIEALQLVTEQGICATILSYTPANTYVELPCISTPDTYAMMLNLTVYNAPGLVTAAIADWVFATQFALYYVANQTLTASDIFVVSRNDSSSYTTLLDALTFQVISDHILPYNTPLFNAYNATVGAVNKTINFTDPADLLYLEQMYDTYLAPSQCSDSWECKKFTRHADNVCVFTSLGYTPWLNGDPAFARGYTGNEGGCQCYNTYDNGYWDFPSMCRQCLAGYGPASQEEWLLAVDYQDQILLAIPDYVELFGSYPVFNTSVFDGTNATTFCRLPVYTSTKETAICGGRGSINVTSSTVELTANVYTDLYDNPLTPACTQILINDSLYLNTNQSIVIQSFINEAGSVLNVIDDTVYFKRQDFYVQYALNWCVGSECSYTSIYDTIYVTCLNALTTTGFGETWTKLFTS